MDAAEEPAQGGRVKGYFLRCVHALKRIDLNPETAFKRKRPPPAPRRVLVNLPLPEEALDARGRVHRTWVHATNQVISAKYTIYNFVFKNLLEQFRRVANIFFLVLVILQFFPQFTTINPGVAMLPLLIVLFITMVKDGYEDIKRHQSDRIVNRQRARTLGGHGFKNHNVTELKSRSLQMVMQAWKRYLIPTSLRKRFGPSKSAVPIDEMTEHAAPASAPRAMSPKPMSPPLMSPILENDVDGIMPSEPMHTEGVRHSYSHMRPTTPQSMYSDMTSRSAQRRESFMSERSGHPLSRLRWKSKHWEDIHVGDIIMLKNNESVPADMLLCATSEDDGSCYVETKNLDGEINLKSRFAVPDLADMNSEEACAERQFDVQVEPQHTDMYHFNARVNLHDSVDEDGEPVSCPVTLNQVLLRGCTLRNTNWVIGVVLMTGVDSKIVLNSGDTPSKRSLMEVLMNKMVYVNLAIIGIIAIICAIADSEMEKYYFARGAYWEYLATQNDDNPSLNGLVSFANSLITFQNIVPIALYISFEVVRTIQALFIFEDHDMYYEKNSRRTTAKSWNLSDELGQVEYIISDKTGTLTQNLMIFRQCAIDGVIYQGGGEASDIKEGRRRLTVRPSIADVPPYYDDELTRHIRDTSLSDHASIVSFFRCLSLCHTVYVTHTDEKNVIMYRAESPDEQALVQTAADNGFVYCGRHINTIELQLPQSEQRERYEVLQVLEFSSARKRMAVILKAHADGKIIMYAKGADSMIYSRLASGQDQIMQATDKALEQFANQGLRTLCMAKKEVDPTWYKEWAHKYQQASVSTENREEQMEELASEIEQEYILLGATAIEDRLQDGVPETIADLKRAGINIWVATGDKLETAIAIGYSTMLLAPDMNLLVIRGGEYGTPNSAYAQLEHALERFFGGVDETAMKHPPPPVTRDAADSAGRSVMSFSSLVGHDNGMRTGGYALVIDGHALGYALAEPHSRELLLMVAKHCRAVVCCRVSPLQKALIVHLVRDGLKGLTLAIGDGANDVSMIQAAHVGVGVAGEEGLQAVNSSDYSIGQFRFLKRLLLVHGHWSYYRNSKMVNVFFYKQMVHTGTLFWFQIYCAWSTTQAIDYVYLLLYNAIWTVAAVIGIGIFDRNLSDHVLMQVPELYKSSRERQYFGLWRFTVYMLDGLYQSVILFFFILYYYDTTTPRQDGYDINLYEPTTGMVLATVLAANLYAGIESLSWTWWIAAVVWIPTMLMFVFEPIYAAFPPSLIWTYSWGNNYLLYRSVQFWLMGIITVFLSLLPRILYEYFRLLFFPTDVDIMRYIDTRDPSHDYTKDPRMPGLRAAQAYDVEPEADLSRGPMNDTYPLMPTSSRTSSIYYDMNTGQQSSYRGYSFSASDTPAQRPRGMVRRIKRLLRPKRQRPSEHDMPYVRARDSALVDPLPSEPGTESEGMEHKRESFVDESVMPYPTPDPDQSRYETAAAAPATTLPERSESVRLAPPLFMPSTASQASVSDAFFSALDHERDWPTTSAPP
ncbi:P-type phospholipid transporter [Malassezia nana]|uniref:Phospholipid-transporting ATPase n=1 Tax=Malassezia nana TaxID=180528 RepID=A0AAF0J1N0_9BASI|nr:P-type phospholipid transporter [Malassezia nana]